LEGEETEEATNIVLGILLVNHQYACILFDSGATHSFVNSEFVKKLASKPDVVDIQLYVTTPLGTIYHTDLIIRDWAINVKRKTIPADLAQLEMQGWDTILGMDWSAKHKVIIGCENKIITFSTPEGERMEFRGNGYQKTMPTISAMQAFKMLRKEC